MNEGSCDWFLQCGPAEYTGTLMRDFHPDEFVDERMAMICEVIDCGEAMSIDHTYHVRWIKSKLWPIADRKPPYDRVAV